MRKQLFLLGTMALLSLRAAASAHCQMPCGIYHDDLVFDQVDQYIETMHKGITVTNDSAFSNVHDRVETIRWVVLKDKESDTIANLITTYFLQQKIKPGEPDTQKRVMSAHKLLFQLVAIKQNNDLKFVKSFSDEWDQFKELFHVEGYECKLEQEKAKKKKELEQAHDHDHDDDHTH